MLSACLINAAICSCGAAENIRGLLNGGQYFFSGFDKIIGPTWRNGEAIWKSLHSHNYYNLFNLDFLATGPFFLLIGWATVVTEMLYPLGMQAAISRRYWGAAVLGMHVFIALFMGLFFFAAMMIVLNLSAWYAPYWQLENLRRPGTRLVVDPA